jgi:hypothetical protein
MLKIMASTHSAQEILLDDATPGMRLAEAVWDRSGTRLISPGTELTEKSIHALKQRGILRVHVARPVAEETPNEDVMQKLQRLDILFKNSLHLEPNRFLMDCLRRYRTRSCNESTHQ